MKAHSLMTNHKTPHQPWLNMPSLIAAMPGGACHPPRNMVVASAETVNMFTYSPRKNIANFSELYAVWNPPVSSPSPSARSKGSRLVSPTMVTTYTRKEGSRETTNHRLFCEATIWEVDIDPLNMKTATSDRPMAIS